MSLANISLVGNLTRPPEQMSFPSGRTKTTMVVAVNSPPRGKQASESTDFYRVETWGKLAELAGKYLAKGNQVTVTGRLIFDHWTDKEGKNRVTPIVKADQLSLPPKLKTVPDTSAPLGGQLHLQDDDHEDLEDADDNNSTPGIPYDPDFAPPMKPGRKAIA